MDNMDEFCGSTFWDSNLTWYTNNQHEPDFTPCFQSTILAWIPCAFLWVFAPWSIYSVWRKKKNWKSIPWTLLNATKMVLTVVLAGLQVSVFVYKVLYVQDENVVYPVVYVTSGIRIATFTLALFAMLTDKNHGVRSSGVQFNFWLLLSLCEAFEFRSLFLSTANTEGNLDKFQTAIKTMFWPTILLQLLLFCWADGRQNLAQPNGMKVCPEEESSYISKLSFSWFSGLAWVGFRKPLEHSDLWDLNEADKCRSIVSDFDKHWQKSQSKSKLLDGDFEEESKDLKKIDPKCGQKNLNIIPALFYTIAPSLAFGICLKLVQDILIFVSLQILSLLIDFVSGEEEEWKGYLYAMILLMTTISQTIFLSHYFHTMFAVGMRVQTVLVCCVYRKSLVLSNTARNEATVGEIVNLMSVDTKRVQDLFPYVNIVWSGPLQITLALYFLWQTLGPSVLAGLAFMIVLIPINSLIAGKMKKLETELQLKNKDRRIKLMHEILTGIKIIKMYAWETSFQEQVRTIRASELKILRTAAFMDSSISFTWKCAPFLVSLVTFATYVLVDEKNVLDPQKAFVSLTLFNILSTPLGMFPMVISSIVQARVSFVRLNKFLNAEEIDQTSVSHEKNQAHPIVIRNGNFAWTEEHLILRDINMHIKQKSLCAIVGEVGSGKSSLLAAILGEMDKKSGYVNTKGSIAYVPQQPWIQNATIKNNILFGSAYDWSKYDKVIESCALTPDLEILPGGDKTEIGEKGINLSGGQKQRLALARAVYNDADVYLLDDPLSAVDSHVGKHIFDNIIGPNGALSGKTRVLVTHGIKYLPEMDFIIVLSGGDIADCGTYQELLQRKGAFSEFLNRHLEVHEHENEDPLLIQAQIVEPLTMQPSATSRARHPLDDESNDKGSALRRSAASLKRKISTTFEQGSNIFKAFAVPTVREGETLIQVEKAETGRVDWKIYFHYMGSVGWASSVWIIILYVVYEGFSVFGNIWLSDWSNEVSVNGSQDISNRNIYLTVYASLGGGQVISILIAGLIMAVGSINAAAILHWDMLNRVMKAPSWFFDTTPTGRIVNRFAKDVHTVDMVLPDNMRDLLACLVNVVATLIVVAYSTPMFLSIIIPIGLLYYFIQRFYIATSRQLKRLESISRSPIFSHFTETLTGTMSIRAFGMQQRFISESEEIVDFNQRAYFPSIVANRWLAIRLELVANLVVLFAALFAVRGRGSLTSGLVGLSLSYAFRITQVLNWLVRMTSAVETSIVAVERMKEYSEVPQEALAEMAHEKPPSTWPQTGAVQFNQYQTRYRDGLELALRDISANIEPAEKIGIVGRTGSGKSSLALALFRILESAGGSIIIDGTDIARIGLYDLRSRLTIIPQDPVLFSGTLRINLDPFTLYSDALLWRSLELAHLKPFIKGLKGGLDYEVSEGGQNLSVGQRQLICLARALLRKSKILVLDEATAQVDLDTDERIQETIRSEFKGCTVLTIAHRLNTILDSTRVLVLDNGKICEFDRPDLLLQNKNSRFYKMAKDAGIL